MHRTLAVAILALSLLLTGCEDHRTPTEQAVEWFPSWARPAARCIVAHESGGNPSKTGSAGEASLFQIHPVHRRSFERLTGRSFYRAAWDPILNGQFAERLWAEQGWRPWTTRRACGL